MQDFANVCEQAARAGGRILRDMLGKIRVREKAPADLVSEADLASQDTIRDFILRRFPEHGFVGEESPSEAAATPRSAERWTWIVDPLDGTTNYVHGLEHFCVSVALQSSRGVQVGAVYDPMREECFTAEAGGGARCNGSKLEVSRVGRLDDALVAASLPARVLPDSPEVHRFLQALYRCQAVRRLGSAALNLCYVAAGRVDAYWATSVKNWDVAAGALIVREAGGVITDVDGGPFRLEAPRLVAAGQSTLHAELVAVLADDAAPQT